MSQLFSKILPWWWSGFSPGLDVINSTHNCSFGKWLPWISGRPAIQGGRLFLQRFHHGSKVSSWRLRIENFHSVFANLSFVEERWFQPWTDWADTLRENTIMEAWRFQSRSWCPCLCFDNNWNWNMSVLLQFWIKGSLGEFSVFIVTSTKGKL